MYWTATVSSIGPDADVMFDAGVFILFREPVPPALAELAIVHTDQKATQDPQVGHVFRIGESSVTFTEVGDLAAKNLHDLGHVVIYVNQPDQGLLPGAIKAEGTLHKPQPGDTLSLEEGK